MRTAAYIETIYKTPCPYCGAINLTNIGDINDLTMLDPEIEECEKCGEEYRLYDEEE